MEVLGAGIGSRVVGKAGQVIHGGIEGQGDTAALLIGIPAEAPLDFGVVALINAG